jgi:formiminoglutamase
MEHNMEIIKNSFCPMPVITGGTIACDRCQSIFKKTRLPAGDYLSGPYDPNDKKLRDLVSVDSSQYEESEIVILGFPSDEGVKRNNGRPGARKAPNRIRQFLYKLPSPAGLEPGQLFDLGDIRVQDTLEHTHALHEEVIYRILKDDKKVVVIGGSNDVSYPDCRGLARIMSDMLVFNIDSHFDVREDMPRNSGTPYRQLLDEGIIKPSRFYEMAVKPLVNSTVYERYLEKIGVPVYSLDWLRGLGVEQTFRKIIEETHPKAIFWGFDLDAVKSSDAPGVSAPYPQGLSADEILKIAGVAGVARDTKIIELSEVNPVYDINNRTSHLAALIILNFLTSWGQQQQK